jgi:hypothetical protein
MGILFILHDFDTTLIGYDDTDTNILSMILIV